MLVENWRLETLRWDLELLSKKCRRNLICTKFASHMCSSVKKKKKKQVRLLFFSHHTGNRWHAVHNLSQTQVQDFSRQRGRFMQDHRQNPKPTYAQMVLKRSEAAGPHSDRDQRGRLCGALEDARMDRIRLLPGRGGQRKKGQSWGRGWGRWGDGILLMETWQRLFWLPLRGVCVCMETV